MQKRIQIFYVFLKLLIFTWLTLVSYNALRKHELYLYDTYCIMINLVPFALCLILLIFSYFLKEKEHKINLEISFFSLIFSFFFLEILITFYEFRQYVFSQDYPLELHQELLGKPVDKRNKIEIIAQFKEKDINAFPLITPYMVLNKKNNFLPVNSLSNSVLVACKEAGEWVHTLSDKYGFRNLNEKYNQTIENIFLVDSYTWGSCVNDNKTVQALFDKSTGSNSLNLGNVGNGPLLALATLNEFGSLFTPKSIFYLFYDGNDFPSDLNQEKKNKVLLSYLDKSFRQDLINNIDETNDYYRKIIEETPNIMKKLTLTEHFKNFFSLKNFINLSRSRHLLNSINPYPDPDFRMLTNVFESIKNTANSIDSKVYFVYLPSWYTVNKTNERFYHKIKSKIINLSNEYFETIDMTPIFFNSADYNDFYNYRKNSHYSEKGYELVAKTLAEKVNPKKID